MRLNRITKVKLFAVSAILMAVAISLFAWAGFNTTDANNQAVRTGVLDLDFGAGNITTPFGTAAYPIVPGDSGCRTVSLINDGNVDLSNVRLFAYPTLATGDYVDAPGSGINAIDETTLSSLSSFQENIYVTVYAQDGGVHADSDPVSTPACSALGWDTTALSTTSLISINTLGESVLLDLGEASFGEFSSDVATLNEQHRKYLKLVYSFTDSPPIPDNAGNVFGNLEWTFTADSRTPGFQDATVPQSPANLVGTAGDTSVDLIWDAPSNGGSAITDYTIQYSSDAGATWNTFADGTSTSASTLVTGLTNGTGYIFKVAATNSIGTSAFSSYSSQVTPATAPGTPTSLAGTAGNTTVALTWTAPASDGGSALTDYNIQSSSDAGSTWSTFADGTSTSASTTVTGLTNGTSYVFRVRAVNANGVGSYTAASSTYIPVTTPGTPTSLAGTTGNTTVDLTWTAPASNGGSALTDYNIQSSSDDGSTWSTFADGTSTTASTTVTGLTNGTSYVFRVRAVNAAGVSSYTAASSTYIPVTAPSSPIDFSGTPGNTTVDLTWTAPASNGGSALTDYDVQYSSDAGSTWSTFVDGTSTSASTTVTGLINGTGYKFRVRAVNAAAAGSYTAASNTYIPVTTPGTPTSLSGTPSNSRVDLTWNAPASNGGSTLTDYDVQYSSNAGSTWSSPLAVGSASTDLAIINLANGTSYVFRVRAVNAVGAGSYTAASSIYIPVTTPSAPTSLSINPGNTTADLTWTAPASDGGSALTDYNIQFSSDDGSTWSTFADGTSNTASTTVTGLTNGTNYIFRVRAVNAVGTGPYSDNSGAYTPATVPGTPTSLAGTADNTTVDLTWTAPASDGGSALTDYNIQSSSDDGSTWSTFADGTSTTTSTTVTGLTNGGGYKFRVRAVNAAGAGSYTAASSTYIPFTTPGTPTSLAGTAGNTTADLTWTAPASNGGSALTDYNIQFSSDDGSTWSTFADGTSTSASTTVTGLTNGTSYVFRVRAVNAAGAGSYTAASSQVTPATVPGTPTSLAGTAGNTTVDLTWTAPASDGGSALTDYNIQSSSDDGSTWSTFADGTSTTTSTTVTGLTNGTSYVFRVRAVNAAGVSSYTAASSTYIPFTTPGTPTSLAGTAGNTTVALTWTAPASNGGSAITDYNIQSSSDDGSTWSTFADGTSNTASTTVTGLTNGTSYVFRVRAVNAAGVSSYTAASSTYIPATVPGTPTSLAGTAGNTTVDLTWTAPASNGGSALTDYNIQSSSDAGSTWSTFADGTSTTTSTTVTGLTNGTSYVFRVRAVNANGAGSYTAAAGNSYSLEQNIYIPFTVPGTPNQPTVGTGTASRLDVSWAAPSNGGSIITSYTARAINGANTFTCTVLGDIGLAPPTACNITGLAVGTTYAVSVSATNLAGTSSWSTATNSATDGVSNYNYLGVDQTFTVPAGVTSLKVKLSGASGSTGENWGGPNVLGCQVYGCFDNLGGNGGVGTATIAVTPGAVYTVCPGGSTGGSSGGWNWGAPGGPSHAGYGGWGGGGGGKTDILLGATSCAYKGFLVAPGGGGGGGNYSAIYPHGTAGGRGGNGGYNGDNGSSGLLCWFAGFGGGGAGGTQSGVGATGVNDSADACGFVGSTQITNHTGFNGDATWGAGGNGTGVYGGGKGGGGGGAGYNGGGGGSTRMLAYGQYGAGGGGGGSSAGLTITGTNAGNGSARLCWGASSTSCN